MLSGNRSSRRLPLPGDLDLTHRTGANAAVARSNRLRTRSVPAVPRPHASRKGLIAEKNAIRLRKGFRILHGTRFESRSGPTMTESNTAAFSARTGRNARDPTDRYIKSIALGKLSLQAQRHSHRSGSCVCPYKSSRRPPWAFGSCSLHEGARESGGLALGPAFGCLPARISHAMIRIH